MEDVKQLMQHHYLKYASYVILDRAIPNVIDGLKPVQRRILHTLWNMHDGKLHKVANVAGQTMAFHPHGDAPITEALVNMANKGYLLDHARKLRQYFYRRSRRCCPLYRNASFRLLPMKRCSIPI